MKCIFCEIARGTAPAEILYESPHAVAILDINPIHFGHALVFPKGHHRTFVDVPPDEMSDIINTAQKVCGAMLKMLNPHGFNIFSNNGVAAGQSVFHFHFHITPRYDGDDIQFVLKLKKYEGDELTRYARDMRELINTGGAGSLPSQSFL